MRLSISTEDIARRSSGRPWLTVGVWLLALVVSVVLIVMFLGDALTTSAELTNNPESERADDLVRERFRSNASPQPATEIVFVSSESLTVDDPQFADFTGRLVDDLKSIGDEFVFDVTSYFDIAPRDEAERFVTADRHTAGIVVLLSPTATNTFGLYLDALGRFIAGDPTLDEGPAGHIGFNGGAVDGFEIHSIRGGDGSSGGDFIIVRSESLAVDDVEYRKFVEELFLDIVSLGRGYVWEGANYYATGEETLVSADRHATLIPMESNDWEIWNRVIDVIDQKRSDERFHVTVTGRATLDNEFSELSEKDLREGELMFGLPVAIIVLLIVFGALVAAAIPLIVAIFSITVALAISAIVGQFYELSIFLVNMIFMMGLAVGIDYSLFVIARFREERAANTPVEAAIRVTGATASRAVLISGITVVLALFGLLIVPHDIFISLGAGAIIVVLVSIVATLTLMPAILALFGDRVNSLRLPLIGRIFGTGETANGEFWARISRTVMRAPVVSVVLAVSLLVAAAIPVLTMNVGVAGVSTFPEDLEARNGFIALQRDFSAGLSTPARIVVDGDIESQAVQDAIGRLRTALEADPAFGHTSEHVNGDQTLMIVDTPIAGGDSTSDAAIDAISRLRGDIVPAAFSGSGARVLVTGETAESVDYINTTRDYMIVVFPFVLVLSFILLTLVFRSLIVPIKAIIMNLLSVGAAYGLMVLVFEKGVANSFFGFHEVDTVEAWVPLFLFAVLFGLSMDYHVFMLSRIRERFLETGDNTESVAFGLSSTGRLITGAALIMVAVFSGFASGSLVMFEQMGFGMSVAIILDATIIRSVLVPATMKLLGKWNWYLPSWLGWLPDLSESSQPASVRSAAQLADN